MSALLEVAGLTVRHRGDVIVDAVDLTLAPGEALGLAGESGCGKTTTALAIMKLLPPALVPSGTITLRPPGVEEPVKIDRRTERGMNLVRWRHVSLVFQGAMNALDPVRRIDHQIAGAILVHEPRAGKLGPRILELDDVACLCDAVARLRRSRWRDPQHRANDRGRYGMHSGHHHHPPPLRDRQ